MPNNKITQNLEKSLTFLIEYVIFLYNKTWNFEVCYEQRRSFGSSPKQRRYA